MDARALTRAGAAVLVALALPALAALALDERQLAGVSVWSKPLKFDLSFALHLLTLGWLLGLLPPAQLQRPWLRRITLVGVFSVLVEALYITLQAARGRASHFNQQTPLEALLYFGVMGTGAVLIVASAFATGLWLWRHADPRVPAGLRRGAVLGLLLGAAATLVVAAVLSSGAVAGPGHWVGGERSDASGLPLLGWSTTGGDLRVPHFLATHLMQALPLAGWLADRGHPARARAWVHVAALLGLGLVVATFWQAVAGRPLLAPCDDGACTSTSTSSSSAPAASPGAWWPST